MRLGFSKAVALAFLVAAFFAQNLAAQCPKKSRAGVHVIQKGENLYRISKKYGLSVDEICRLNGISKDEGLRECEELLVAKSGKKSQESTAPGRADVVVIDPKTGSERPFDGGQGSPSSGTVADDVHVVKDGETLESIADQYGYTAWRFREINGLRDWESVEPGRILRNSECLCPASSGRKMRSSRAPKSSEIDLGNRPEPGWQSQPERPKFDENRPGSANPTPPATQPNNSGGTVGIEKPMPKSNGSALPAAPAESNARFMSSEENRMLDEVNLIRSNPAGYVKYVDEFIADMKKSGGQGGAISTAQELIGELKKLGPLSRLEAADCLYNAAVRHGKDQKPTGDVNHQGTDGSWPWDRALRECKNFQDGNENLVGGPADIRRAVMLLLVDEGIDNRGHRRTLLEPNWKYGACHKVGTVGTLLNCWIQMFGY